MCLVLTRIRDTYSPSEYCTSALKRKRVSLWLGEAQALGSSERGAEKSKLVQGGKTFKEVKRTSLTPCLLQGLTPAAPPRRVSMTIYSIYKGWWTGEKQASAVKSCKRMQV
jgi:hypothetical protein